MSQAISNTKSDEHKIKRRKKIQWLYRWHKRIGLFFCVWLILLAITGILLNHTDDFSLNQKLVESNWLLDWHEIAAPEEAASFVIAKKEMFATDALAKDAAAKEKTMTQIDHVIFLNNKAISQSSEPLVGSIKIDHLEIPMIVIAFQTHLEQLTEDGEKIDALSLDFSVKKIGFFYDNEGKPAGIIETSDGNYLYSYDLTAWKIMQQPLNASLEKAPLLVTLPDIHWSQPIQLTNEQLQKIQKQYRQTQLSWEKVILSLHNGYFFGSIGKWLTDLWGLFALLISITGLYLWQQKADRLPREPRLPRKP